MKEIKYYTLYMLERAKHDILKDRIKDMLYEKITNQLDQQLEIIKLKEELKAVKLKNKELRKEIITNV